MDDGRFAVTGGACRFTEATAMSAINKLTAIETKKMLPPTPIAPDPANALAIAPARPKLAATPTPVERMEGE
jgi:hypothetical protein